MLQHSTATSLFTAAVFSWIGDRLLENTLSRMGNHNEQERKEFLESQHKRKKHISELLDPYAGCTNSSEEKKKATDEDKERYLDALSNPKGFKSLAEITAAVIKLNKTIETMREHT